GDRVGSVLAQDDAVKQILEAVDAKQPQDVGLFGRQSAFAGDTSSIIDFSQFIVRGHYEKSVRLQKYFRAQMWCGLIDLRVAGPKALASPRELGTAIVLLDLLNRAGERARWMELNQWINFMVGP